MSGPIKLAQDFIEFSPRLTSKLVEQSPIEDALEFLDAIDESTLLMILPHLKSYFASSFFSYMNTDKLLRLLKVLPDAYCALGLLNIEPQKKKNILSQLPDYRKARITKLMSFVPESAGFFMDSSIAPLKVGDTISQCISKVKNTKRSIYYLYVIDEEEILVGVLTLKNLLVHPDLQSTVEKIMEKQVECIHIDEFKKEIIKNPSWKFFHAMPVVDNEKKLLGLIRYDTYTKMLHEQEELEKIDDNLASTGQALGELYKLGLVALFDSTSSFVNKNNMESE